LFVLHCFSKGRRSIEKKEKKKKEKKRLTSRKGKKIRAQFLNMCGDLGSDLLAVLFLHLMLNTLQKG